MVELKTVCRGGCVTVVVVAVVVVGEEEEDKEEEETEQEKNGDYNGRQRKYKQRQTCYPWHGCLWFTV